ncbi:DUF2493 domain-containing protein [Streptomyces scopuliridis]|uniref:SLOG family protein n=1 Tax=Streptomyces scopuliridis TaxID=452529 RepID=UPI002DD901E0|nr:SLOG family protein [Streptomyces scopuliridis]WSB37201.1 DUF2493 domain-containing protein [Streptomyces scopuliridis]
MRVIATGSRKWANALAVYDALWDVYQKQHAFHLVHGACATGADALAAQWFRVAGQYLGCTVETFPANWAGRGKAAGPERNRRMVNAGADLVLPFPLPEGTGTQMTMQYAKEMGIKVRVIEP